MSPLFAYCLPFCIAVAVVVVARGDDFVAVFQQLSQSPPKEELTLLTAAFSLKSKTNKQHRVCFHYP